MIYVGVLTEIQKQDLIGVQYAPDCFFNAIQDIDENWVISTQEMNDCINPNYNWVKQLPLIEYKPIPTPIPTL